MAAEDVTTAASTSASLASRCALSALLLMVLAVSTTGALDRPAAEYAQSALARAMVTFGVARSLNGVISVVQETEVALQPAGVGVTLAPGQLLDPLNDLIERFSWIMLGSGVALGVESTLLRMASWWPFDLLVAGAVLVLLVVVWQRHGGAAHPYRAVLQRLALTVLFTRFVVPSLLVVTSALSGFFLQAEQERATQALRDSADEVAVLAQEVEAQAQPAPPQDASFLERLGDYVGDRFATLDVSQRIERARQLLADATSQVITLAASFLLETMIIPLALLWLSWQALRWTFLPIRRGG